MSARSTLTALRAAPGGPVRRLLAALLALASGLASAQADLPDDLMTMSLEALMDIEVTSVSKKPQKKSSAAAAIFVITGDDLRNWGVTNIPDALRRVPGLEVARLDANKWAITARGFNSRFANKLLVMIDGRTIYTPLFTGVYWEANHVMLEDVERIEVIRGPGGTLWGANAVNGVINIITRSAADTQGTLATLGAGSELERMVNVRHGGKTDGGRHYRVYALSNSADTGYLASGTHDDYEISQGGFRSDWRDGSSVQHTLQGDYYDGRGGQELLIAPTAPSLLVDNADMRGGNLLYRMTRATGDDSGYTLQAYYDYVGRESAVFFEDRHTFDLDFQHHDSPLPGHEVIWGLNYRRIEDDTDPTLIFSLNPGERETNLYTAFVQDEIRLPWRNARLTLGSKFEHNDFTGFEYQPNIRIAIPAGDDATWWGAVSRAVRTPARGEHDVTLALMPPGSTLSGDSRFISETLIAWELGYRRRLSDAFSYDVTAFLNKYEDLRTLENLPAGRFDNNMRGDTHGIELDARWRVSPRVTANANYSWFDIDLEPHNGSTDIFSESTEGVSPEHQLNLWLQAQLSPQVDGQAYLRYVDSVAILGYPEIDSYVAVDARLAWRPRRGVELALTGQNLFDSHHPEFSPGFILSTPTEVERSLHVTIIVELP